MEEEADLACAGPEECHHPARTGCLTILALLTHVLPSYSIPAGHDSYVGTYTYTLSHALKPPTPPAHSLSLTSQLDDHRILRPPPSDESVSGGGESPRVVVVVVVGRGGEGGGGREEGDGHLGHALVDASVIAGHRRDHQVLRRRKEGEGAFTSAYS